MTRRAIALLIPLALATGLAGCKDNEEPQQASAAAGAELLPRSVDDDMPAYDTVRSKAPLEEPAASASPTGPAAEADDAAPNEPPAPSEESLGQGDVEEPAQAPAATPDAE